MKSLIIFILGAVVGLVIGAKLGYEYVITSVSDNMDSVISTFVDQGFASGANSISQSMQTKGSQFIEEQKAKTKAAMEAEFRLYINQKIDGFFK